MSRIAEALAADLFDFDRRHAEHTDPPAADINDVPTDVRFHFERLALEVAARGFTHYSSDAILHQVRWHMHVDRGIREFKCNDHWTAPLARWFLERHPDMGEFFELRERKSLKGVTV